MPILLYGLEVCALDKRSVQLLDFTVNRFFMKLFKTSDITRECQSLFGFDPASTVLFSGVASYGALGHMPLDTPISCLTIIACTTHMRRKGSWRCHTSLLGLLRLKTG